MKRKFILFTATLGIAYVTFSSYSSGPAFGGGLNRTGAPGTVGNCSGSGCHSGNSPDTKIAISMVVKGTSTPVTEYIAGTVYTVTVVGSNTSSSSSSLVKFGFQVCVEKKSDHSNSGTLTATNTNTAVRNLGSVKVIEHKTPLSAVTAGNYLVQFEWTAPVAGSGDVAFYGILNAVNDNGNTSGDMPGDPVAVTFGEASSSSVAEASQSVVSKLYPNPAGNLLNVAIEKAIAGTYTLSVTDLNGRIVNTITQASAGSHLNAAVNVSDLAPGNYFLKVQAGNNVQVVPFIKK